MTDAEVWLILVNGLAAQCVSNRQVAEEADELLLLYRARFPEDDDAPE